MHLLLLSLSLNSAGCPDLFNSLKIGLGSLMDIYSPFSGPASVTALWVGSFIPFAHASAHLIEVFATAANIQSDSSSAGIH